MEPPQLTPIQPVQPIVSKVKSSNRGLAFIVIFMTLVLLGGLAYTNVMLTQSGKKIEDFHTQLEEVSKKGGSDQLLGFDKVDKGNLQSVTLTSGQNYFGKITSMTTENIVIEDI